MRPAAGPVRWWSVLPWLLLLLGAGGMLADRARSAATAEPARAGFWDVRAPDGSPRAAAADTPGLALGAGDVLQLRDAEGPRYRLTALAVTAKPEAGASIRVSLRVQDERSYALVVSPGENPGLELFYREPGRPPLLLKQAPLAALEGRPLDLRLELDADRFTVRVNGREALTCRDGRLTEGRASLQVRQGSCVLESLTLSAERTTQAGQVEPITRREDFAPRAGASAGTEWRQVAGLVAGALLVAALYLRALSRGTAGAGRLAQASAICLAPVAVLHAQGLFREPVLPGPVVGAAALVGLLLALRTLATAAEAPPPRRAFAAGLRLVVLVALAAAAVLGVYRAHEAEVRPLIVQERLATTQPLAEAYQLPAPLELDAGNSVVLPGPFRDLDLQAEFTPGSDTIFELRLRATEPPSCRGIALWVPSDPRLATGWRREDLLACEPLGEQLAAVRAGERVRVELQLRGREFRAVVNGQAVHAESLAFASGAVVLMAARGAARLEALSVTPRPHAPGTPPPWTGWIGSALLPLLLVAGFSVLAAALLRTAFPSLLEACAFALLPVAFGLPADVPAAALGHAGVAQLACAVALLLFLPVCVLPRSRPVGRCLLLAAAAVACAPVIVVAASPPLPVAGWNAWSGKRLEDDLAWLQHPALRALNGYLADHRFRGRALTQDKPAGTRRVLTAGASSTYGFAIPDGSGGEYPMILERLLNEAPPPGRAAGAPQQDAERVEVLNAAVLGATSEQQFRLLRDALLVFDPDVVTLSLYYNDSFSLTSMDVARTVEQPGAPGYRRSWLDELLLAWSLPDESQRTARLCAAFRTWEGSTEDLWEALDLDPGERTPPERYEAMLRRFAELGRERGFALVLVKEPVRDERSIWKEEFYGAMDRVAAEYGLHVVDPGPALQAAGGAALFMDPVHLRPEGLAIVAQELARAVRACLDREQR